MSLSDFLRGFLGLGSEGRRDPFFRAETRGEEEEEDDEDDEGDPFGFGFEADGRQGFPGFSGFFREMDDLFRGIGSWDVPSRGLDPPSAEEGRRRRAPRDWMLKEPDSEPAVAGGRGAAAEPGDWPGADTAPASPGDPVTRFAEIRRFFPSRQEASVKEDQDLDSEVTSGGLGTILRPAEPHTRSFFHSVSVSTVTLPDGTVEERRTVRDSQGNEKTEVTRRRVGVSHSDETQSHAGDLQPFPPAWERETESQTLHDMFTLWDRLFRGLFSSR